MTPRVTLALRAHEETEILRVEPHDPELYCVQLAIGELVEALHSERFDDHVRRAIEKLEQARADYHKRQAT